MPSTNPFAGSGSEPARQFFTIAPNDATDLPSVPRGVYVGGAGDIVATGHDGVDVTFKAVPVGTTLPISPKRIKATLTTATLMIGLV